MSKSKKNKIWLYDAWGGRHVEAEKLQGPSPSRPLWQRIIITSLAILLICFFIVLIAGYS